MERRVLLAVILSFLVLYAYQALFPPPSDQPAQQRKPVQSSKTATAPKIPSRKTQNMIETGGKGRVLAQYLAIHRKVRLCARR